MVAISIVIPVYNIEKYLKECLDSIVNQTFKDFEAICVNDGSKDNSLKILEEYTKKDSRFRVISQENGGSGSARNNGLRHAQGKYVQFLDGDDYFEPNMLETLYNLAEKYQADIAVCSSKKVNDDGIITESKNPNFPLNLYKIFFNKTFNYKDFPEDIFNLIGAVPWNKLYLKEMLNKNNLRFPNLIGPDDLCFVYMANVCAEKIIATNEEFINYRYNRPGSIQTYRANHIIDNVKAGLYIKDFLLQKNIYNLLEKGFLNSQMEAIRGAISYCNEVQYENFIKELKILLPEDWQMYASAIKKNTITLEYLNKFIDNNKVYLWGASNFLKNILEKEEKTNPNILGIIDKNEASWGNDFCGYKIFSPNILNTKPAKILVTVYNNPNAYSIIKKEVEENYIDCKVLENIL